ncbi:hypothetical protein K1T71_000269 [Dendrolimus kikuchii]|uniref:Uncharacterized protein n=1 Tax=Dendrolimus kikuchii TaxID=765133 RepID=A0ACC1DJ42_9NEOP|nr:hypothetical protein K1T71_000269 [Dendrolimus kikuchii]
MNTAIALLVAVTAVCAIARPSGPTLAPALAQELVRMQVQRAPPPPKQFLRDYLLPQMEDPNYLAYEENSRIPLPPRDHDWLNKEIARLNQMEEEDSIPYEQVIPRWFPQDSYVDGVYVSSIGEPNFIPESHKNTNSNHGPKIPESEFSETIPRPNTKKDSSDYLNGSEDPRKKFALTPLDKGYYEKNNVQDNLKHYHGRKEGEDSINGIGLQPPRQIRQNPNLSKSRTLVGHDLSKLRTKLSTEDGESTKLPEPLDSPVKATPDPAEPIYGIALIAAIGAAVTIAIFGFAFGWYTLSKKAKAAADVDYPAYGVTGPTIDISGDRKLAQSAHMYHYQHQKQQIIAMERNGLEHRNGSVSDPESEEENEEGDYTVYECPGFATTGDMEVKNPLFSEDPTPATPGKCEVVKPQPKD